jgi:hypothetical protein
MRSIHKLIDHTLTLVQPKWTKQHYELRFGDEVVAKLSMPKAFSSLAEVITADGSWSISRENRILRKVRAIRKDEINYAAVCKPNTWKGETEIVLQNGKKYTVKSNAWKTLTEIRTETGEVLISIKTEGFFRNTTRITMTRTAAVVTPALPLLVMLGIYIEMLNRKETHSTVVAVGV